MSLDPADPIGGVFAPVIGRPCWNVRPGAGTAFMMEFGEPRLDIREPIASTSESDKVRTLLARRRIDIVGDWSLVIEFCRWQVYKNDVLVASSGADPVEIGVVVEALGGQRLLAASADGSAGTSHFEFDLGGVIETSRFDDDTAGDWFVLTPEQMCLTYRGDGTYSWGPSTRTDAEQVWVPLPR